MKILAYLATISLFASHVMAQEHSGKDDRWGETSAEIRQWYRELMQPDNPTISCCGEADAYWADLFEVAPDGSYIAIITEEERKVVPQGRPNIPSGTKIPVPNRKLKFDRGNPTGHGIIFMSGAGDVYCYIVPGGV